MILLPKSFFYIEQASWLEVGEVQTFKGMKWRQFSKVSRWELKQVCFVIFQRNAIFLSWLLLPPTLAGRKEEKVLWQCEMEQEKRMNF